MNLQFYPTVYFGNYNWLQCDKRVKFRILSQAGRDEGFKRWRIRSSEKLSSWYIKLGLVDTEKNCLRELKIIS